MTSTTIQQSQSSSAEIIRFPAHRVFRSLKDRAALRTYYRKLAPTFDGAMAWKIATNAHALDRHIQGAPDRPRAQTPKPDTPSKEEALLEKLERRIEAKRTRRLEELHSKGEQESERA